MANKSYHCEFSKKLLRQEYYSELAKPINATSRKSKEGKLYAWEWFCYYLSISNWVLTWTTRIQIFLPNEMQSVLVTNGLLLAFGEKQINPYLPILQ